MATLGIWPLAALVEDPDRQARRTWVLSTDTAIEGVVIPAGFLTDLASVPRWATPLIDRTAWPWVAAGIVHDFRYVAHETDRAAADAEMSDIARQLGASRRAAFAAWVAVRLFGRRAWQTRGAEGLNGRTLR
jgi:hypothetical protein